MWMYERKWKFPVFHLVLLRFVYTVFGAHVDPYSVCTGCSFPGVKAAETTHLQLVPRSGIRVSIYSLPIVFILISFSLALPFLHIVLFKEHHCLYLLGAISPKRVSLK
jgi:hypothetical protein